MVTVNTLAIGPADTHCGAEVGVTGKCVQDTTLVPIGVFFHLARQARWAARNLHAQWGRLLLHWQRKWWRSR